MHLSPSASHATPVLPEPANGSSTVPPGGVTSPAWLRIVYSVPCTEGANKAVNVLVWSVRVRNVRTPKLLHLKDPEAGSCQ